MKLTPNMLRGLAAAVETPGGVTTTPSTIDALIRRGLVSTDGRMYGQRPMRPTSRGTRLIESLGGPREARQVAYGCESYEIDDEILERP